MGTRISVSSRLVWEDSETPHPMGCDRNFEESFSDVIAFLAYPMRVTLSDSIWAGCGGIDRAQKMRNCNDKSRNVKDQTRGRDRASSRNSIAEILEMAGHKLSDPSTPRQPTVTKRLRKIAGNPETVQLFFTMELRIGGRIARGS